MLERRLPFFCLSRPLRASLLFATALLGALACTPPEAPRTAPPADGRTPTASGGTAGAGAIRAELEAVNLSMTEAFNRGDRLAAARHYADDARILGPGGERVSGRGAIDAYWARFRQGSRWRLEVLEAGGDRDAPWQLGRSTLVMPTDEGGTTASVVDFVGVWKRQRDGSLRLYLDMWNPAPKAQPLERLRRRPGTSACCVFSLRPTSVGLAHKASPALVPGHLRKRSRVPGSRPDEVGDGLARKPANERV